MHVDIDPGDLLYSYQVTIHTIHLVLRSTRWDAGIEHA